MTIFNVQRLFILFFLLLLSGCLKSSKIPVTQQIAPLRNEPVCRIAVIPFINNSDYHQGNTLAYRIFVTELQRSGNFLVLQEGDVRKVLQQFRVNPNKRPDYEKMKILAGRLDAQLVISGELIHMSEEKHSGQLNPSLILSLRVADGLSGKTMWDTYHSKTGEDYRKVLHFGYVNTISKLTQLVSQEILDLWYERGLSQCSDG